MSRDIGETYRRAVDIATDGHNAPGRLETLVEAFFELSPIDPFDVWCRDVMIRNLGLVFCPVTLDGDGHFDIPSRHQGAPGWPAWVMPVFAWGAGADGEPLIEDLIAFCDSGKHAGKVWTCMGYAPALGFDVPESQRSLKVFTQPKLWLQYWIAVARQRGQMRVTAPWPDQAAALVLDPKRIRWKPIVQLTADVPFTVETIDFADSPALRDYAARVMKVEMPPLPRLRAAKAKPEPERPHGPTPPEPASPALAAAGERAAR